MSVIRSIASDGTCIRPEAESIWFRRLAWDLISGVSKREAVGRCCASGCDEATALGAVEAILTDPLYDVAALHATRLQSRDWMLDVYSHLAELDCRPICDEVTRHLSRDAFLADYYKLNRPVCLRGFATDWPAVIKWSDPAYLARACGDMQVEVMVGREAAAIKDQNTSQHLRRRVPWSSYVNLVFASTNSNDYYIVSRNHFFDQADAQTLLHDITIPPYAHVDDAGEDVRLWFGPGGTVTSLHQDNINSLFVQVVGKKAVRLYPPWAAPAMQQRMLWYAGIEPSGHTESDPGVQRNPRGVVLQLDPGDALFIPVGWWHEVHALCLSMTVSFFNFGISNNYPVSWKYPFSA